MGLQQCLIIISLLSTSLCFSFGVNNSDIQLRCPDYGKIEFAKVEMVKLENFAALVYIECDPSYELIGRNKFRCTDGQWEQLPRPTCVAKELCLDPPDILNGRLTLEGEKNLAGFYKKGTLVTYTCNDEYRLSPPETKYRVCEKGIWTGGLGKCVPKGCKSPKDIENGYYVTEKNGVLQDFSVGQRVYYSCTSGYVLKGAQVQQCIEDGSWSPRIPPFCTLEFNVEDNNELSCRQLPVLPHVLERVVEGEATFGSAAPGTVLSLRCAPGYINSARPTAACLPVILRCDPRGVWIGNVPHCEVAKGCMSPPSVDNAVMVGRESLRWYPVGSQVTYECLDGATPRGPRRLTCAPTGCWQGNIPVCRTVQHFIDEYMTASGTLLVSMATAAGVMLMLLGVCVVVTCRRRKSSPGSSAPPPLPTSASVSADSTAALLDDPDRLALIAFADGLQSGQNSGLPSYEEAIRERSSGPGLLGYRPHRPHWPALGGRRGRGPTAGGETLITRQSSGTSHSASMRSGSAGDPMGSTDTMTPSEVSTNVTLDTVSSHSGSQPASCRAICGSLASFDTSSVINTEGVPLLEENEMEETPCADTRSISMADNASFKNHRTSPDLA